MTFLKILLVSIIIFIVFLAILKLYTVIYSRYSLNIIHGRKHRFKLPDVRILYLFGTLLSITAFIILTVFISNIVQEVKKKDYTIDSYNEVETITDSNLLLNPSDDNSHFDSMFVNSDGNYIVVGKDWNEHYPYPIEKNVELLEINPQNEIINQVSIGEAYDYRNVFYFGETSNQEYLLINDTKKLMFNRELHLAHNESLQNKYLNSLLIDDGFVLVSEDSLDIYNKDGDLINTIDWQYNKTDSLLMTEKHYLIAIQYKTTTKINLLNGEIIWQRDNNLHQYVNPNDAIITKDGNLVVIGGYAFERQKTSFFSSEDILIVINYVQKININTGDVMWKTFYGGRSYELAINGNSTHLGPNIDSSMSFSSYMTGEANFMDARIIENEDAQLLVTSLFDPFYGYHGLMITKLTADGFKLGESILEMPNYLSIDSTTDPNYDNKRIFNIYLEDDRFKVLGIAKNGTDNQVIAFMLTVNPNNLHFHKDLYPDYDNTSLEEYNQINQIRRVVLLLAVIMVLYFMIKESHFNQFGLLIKYKADIKPLDEPSPNRFMH